MRIKSIRLTWFRGAADPVSLEPDSKSMVVYGLNGSGKSSFVDAVEFILRNGKIGHLSHEYSGNHQIKAIPNTHKPQDRKTELSIKFQDESELKTEIKQNGTTTSSGAEAVAMGTWEYRQTVLRQDEVAEFIGDTKLEKYSALLPLFGLDQMEVAAENLHKLTGSVEREGNLAVMKSKIAQVNTKRKEVFGIDGDDQILQTIKGLHKKYCPESVTTDASTRCKELEAQLDLRIAQFSEDFKRHVVLQDTAKLDLQGQIDAVRATSVDLARAAEPLVTETLEVLKSASAFLTKVGEKQDVNCPACGRPIPVTAFNDHVKIELEGLKKINDISAVRKAAVGSLTDTIRSIKTNLRESRREVVER